MRTLALATLAIAAPACADPLQDQVLAGMRRTDTGTVPLTATTRIERTGAAAREIVTHYDPRGAAGRRWSVIRYDGRAPTAKETSDVLKAANGSPVPSYARLAKWFGGPATRVAQTPGSVSYRFARLPAGALKIGSHDASADTSAEAVVDTSGPIPFVSRVRLTSMQGFRAMLVAKVDRYLFASTYVLLPDGRPFPATLEAQLTGAMLGKHGGLTTRTRYEAR